MPEIKLVRQLVRQLALAGRQRQREVHRLGPGVEREASQVLKHGLLLLRQLQASKRALGSVRVTHGGDDDDRMLEMRERQTHKKEKKKTEREREPH